MPQLWVGLEMCCTLCYECEHSTTAYSTNNIKCVCIWSKNVVVYAFDRLRRTGKRGAFDCQGIKGCPHDHCGQGTDDDDADEGQPALLSIPCWMRASNPHCVEDEYSNVIDASSKADLILDALFQDGCLDNSIRVLHLEAIEITG